MRKSAIKLVGREEEVSVYRARSTGGGAAEQLGILLFFRTAGPTTWLFDGACGMIEEASSNLGGRKTDNMMWDGHLRSSHRIRAPEQLPTAYRGRLTCLPAAALVRRNTENTRPTDSRL